MKKLISILIIAFISLISILNVNAFWTYYDSATITINWKDVWTWKQVYMKSTYNDLVYFWIRNELDDWISEYKYYSYVNWEKIEVEESESRNNDWLEMDQWTISEKYIQNYDSDNNTITVKINWYNYWPYNADTFMISNMSNNAFWFKYTDNSKEYYNIFTYFDEEETEVESNPVVDKLLNKVFLKIDKKWDEKAKIVYKSLVNRINKLLVKAKSESKKELLEYIKMKVKEKIN